VTKIQTQEITTCGREELDLDEKLLVDDLEKLDRRKIQKEVKYPLLNLFKANKILAQQSPLRIGMGTQHNISMQNGKVLRQRYQCNQKAVSACYPAYSQLVSHCLSI
jgi:hypothetical protein